MVHSHFGHSHHHSNQEQKGRKLGITILLNIFITAAQVAGGIYSGSLSLLSDALHNFSDVLALVISYIADLLVKKKYTAEQTYGYKRAEIIAAMINSMSLLAIAVLLAKESISRLLSPIQIDSSIVIVLAVLSVLLNGVSVLILKHEAKENINIRSAYLHLFTDMLTSIGVLIGGVTMYYYKIYFIDSILSIFISVYLVYSSFGLLTQTLKVLMQFAPANIDVSSIEKDIMKISSIDNIHHVHIWQLNDKDIHLEAHINFSEDLELSKVTEITSQVSQMVNDKYKINHTVFQQEVGKVNNREVFVKNCVADKCC